ADYALPPATDESHFDVALTAAAMHYLSDLHTGRIDPRGLGFDLDVASRRLYLPAVLTNITVSNEPAAMIAAVERQNDNYRGRLASLPAYRSSATESEGEQPLPVAEKVKVGDAYAAVPQLATALRRTGDLAANVAVTGTTYDAALAEAVKKFQTRH